MGPFLVSSRTDACETTQWDPHSPGHGPKGWAAMGQAAPGLMPGAVCVHTREST